MANFPPSPSQHFSHPQDHRPGGLPSLPILLRKGSILHRERSDRGNKRSLGPARRWQEMHYQAPVSHPWNTLAFHWEAGQSVTPSPLLYPSSFLGSWPTRFEWLRLDKQATVDNTKSWPGCGTARMLSPCDGAAEQSSHFGEQQCRS